MKRSVRPVKNRNINYTVRWNGGMCGIVHLLQCGVCAGGARVVSGWVLKTLLQGEEVRCGTVVAGWLQGDVKQFLHEAIFDNRMETLNAA